MLQEYEFLVYAVKGSVLARSIRIIIFSSITLALVVLLCVYHQPLMDAIRWFGDPNTIVQSIQGYGLWGVALLFGLFLLQTFIALIPGQALMVASGFIYGFAGGMLITWTSLVVGGQIAFWLARRFGRPFAEKRVSPRMLDRWDKSAAGQGVGFYVITLVLPFFPNDAMCYVAGLGILSFRRFLLANMLGRGIASLLTVFVGAYAVRIPGLVWIALAGFIVIGILGWVAARRFGKL